MGSGASLSAAKAYLEDPATDAAGRERCRREQLEPLDGQASARLVELIAAQAQRAAQKNRLP